MSQSDACELKWLHRLAPPPSLLQQFKINPLHILSIFWSLVSEGGRELPGQRQGSAAWMRQKRQDLLVSVAGKCRRVQK